MVRNNHPTVKPLKLCRWLATLLLPPAGYTRRLLVPFAGSGSEMIGAALAGWDYALGIEQSAEYAEIARARLRFWRGWQARGYSEPKEILQAARKGERVAAAAQQMEL